MADEDLKNPSVRALRDRALSYPETHEAFPWGHRVVKVREKVFVFFGGDAGEIGISVKLPLSGEAALSLPFTEPTGYGMGKSGWVTARFPAGEGLPVPILGAWIDESFRAIAPKRLVASLDGVAPGKTKARAAAPAKKTVAGKKAPSAAAPKKTAASANKKARATKAPATKRPARATRSAR